jgi:hypothetical protein
MEGITNERSIKVRDGGSLKHSLFECVTMQDSKLTFYPTTHFQFNPLSHVFEMGPVDAAWSNISK